MVIVGCWRSYEKIASIKKYNGSNRDSVRTRMASFSKFHQKRG